MTVEIEKVYDVDRDLIKREKLEVALHSDRSRTSTTVRLHVWSVGWIWIDARKGNKDGWTWNWNSAGRLLGHFTGKDVIIALEKTYALAFGMEKSRTAEFAEIWKPMLAKGPVEVQ